MKNKKYTVIIDTNGGTIIHQTNEDKDISEWIDAYTTNEHAIELQIFERDGMGYCRVVHEHKRRIGF